MILLPNWEGTRWVMKSFLPFVALAGLYVYLLTSVVNGESAAALASPQLETLVQLFGNPQATAAGWVHFLLMDLFVGRWVYWEGQRTGVWTVHSLIFCFLAGPVGLLSHIVTQGITERFFHQPSESAEVG